MSETQNTQMLDLNQNLQSYELYMNSDLSIVQKLYNSNTHCKLFIN